MNVFYTLQSERGEDSAHPNLFRVPGGPSGGPPPRVTLQDVQDAFPLSGSGSFHFRFQVKADGAPLWLDLVNPSDVVPTSGPAIIAKVLRLGACRSIVWWWWGGRDAAAPVRHSVTFLSPPPPPHSTPPTDNIKCAAHNALNLHLRPPPAGGAAAATPSAATASAAAPSRDPPPPTPGARPVNRVEHVAAQVEVPDHVDDDLADKSDYVKAAVMARRNELARKQAAAVAETNARDEGAVREQADRDAAAAMYGPALAAWAAEPSGTKKSIRSLLSTMHTVLWEGAKWEPVPLAKLVVPARVKFYFMRAATVVHPDKMANLDPGQKFIATSIFHAVETAYRAFAETELGG